MGRYVHIVACMHKFDQAIHNTFTFQHRDFEWIEASVCFVKHVFAEFTDVNDQAEMLKDTGGNITASIYNLTTLKI